MAQKIDSTSSDYQNSRDYWLKVSTMLAGTQAMRDAKYLPRFLTEDDAAYKERNDNARFTNLFGDIVDNLAARPFSKEIKIDKLDSNFEKYMEDIDGMKNHVHRWASTWFKNGVAYGIEWAFVDYTRTNPMTVGADGTPRRKTISEERTSGARPYANRVKAIDVLAVYSAFINGVEKFVHVRMRETSVEVIDYEEVTVERIRELNRAPILDELGNIKGYAAPTWVIWKKMVKGKGKTLTWHIEDQGVLSIGEIPLVPFIVGERDVGWHVVAAMNDVVDLQMEYFEEENGLKNLKKLTAFPMLTASGVAPPMETVKLDDGTTTTRPMKAPVGPRAVLYAPANDISGTAGEWKFIEPAGTSLNFLSGDLDKLEKQVRELGGQPLTANSGNLTVVTTAFAANKGNAAIQNWALDFKDALENVLMYMAMWESAPEPTVEIPLDFSLEFDDNKTFDQVVKMRENGDLSRGTMWKEAQRRKILSDEFDADTEEDAIEDELPGEAEIDDALAAANVGQTPPLDPTNPLEKEDEEVIA